MFYVCTLNAATQVSATNRDSGVCAEPFSSHPPISETYESMDQLLKFPIILFAVTSSLLLAFFFFKILFVSRSNNAVGPCELS